MQPTYSTSAVKGGGNTDLYLLSMPQVCTPTTNTKSSKAWEKTNPVQRSRGFNAPMKPQPRVQRRCTRMKHIFFSPPRPPVQSSHHQHTSRSAQEGMTSTRQAIRCSSTNKPLSQHPQRNHSWSRQKLVINSNTHYQSQQYTLIILKDKWTPSRITANTTQCAQCNTITTTTTTTRHHEQQQNIRKEPQCRHHHSIRWHQQQNTSTTSAAAAQLKTSAAQHLENIISNSTSR